MEAIMATLTPETEMEMVKICVNLILFYWHLLRLISDIYIIRQR